MNPPRLRRSPREHRAGTAYEPPSAAPVPPHCRGTTTQLEPLSQSSPSLHSAVGSRRFPALAGEGDGGWGSMPGGSAGTPLGFAGPHVSIAGRCEPAAPSIACRCEPAAPCRAGVGTPLGAVAPVPPHCRGTATQLESLSQAPPPCIAGRGWSAARRGRGGVQWLGHINPKQQP